MYKKIMASCIVGLVGSGLLGTEVNVYGNFDSLNPKGNAPVHWVKEFDHQSGLGETRLEKNGTGSVFKVMTEKREVNFYTENTYKAGPGQRITIEMDAHGEGYLLFKVYLYDIGYFGQLSSEKQFLLKNEFKKIKATFLLKEAYPFQKDGKSIQRKPSMVRIVFTVGPDSLVVLKNCKAYFDTAPFRVVTSEKAAIYEQTAAKELETYLGKIVKEKLSVGGTDGIVFHVGNTGFAKSKGLDNEKLRDEEWVIKSFGKDVVLNGGGTRGTLYAVYHFLEDVCDVHWWNPEEEYLPAPSDISLKSMDLHGTPAFFYRDIYAPKEFAGRDKFAIRIRLNRAGDVPIRPEFGGAFTYGTPYHCHTFSCYIPQNRFFKDHPEYFALKNGKRGGGNLGGAWSGQLCLSNPALKDIFLKQLKGWIQMDRRRADFNGTAYPRIYDLSQNDGTGPCECEKCAAQVKKYGHSGQLLLLLNDLADEIRKEYPDIYLSTLAYGYSIDTPKSDVRPRDNLIIKLARSSKTNTGRSISSPDNAEWASKIRDWSKIAKNLFIWDYAHICWEGVQGLPAATELEYGETHQFYRDNNVKGLFWEQGNPYLEDMYDLKVFLESKLMENPDADLQKLTKLFMEKYYGAAGKYIYEYRRTLQDALKRNNGYIGGNPRVGTFSYLDDAAMCRCHKIFDDAENAVQDSPLRRTRVRRARLGLDRLTCRKGFGFPLRRFGAPPVTTSLLDFAAAQCRIREVWPSTLESAVLSSRVLPVVTAEMEQYNLKRYPNEPSPPKYFQGKIFYDFPANRFEDQSKGRSTLVAAPDAESGYALKIPLTSSTHIDRKPLCFGVYSTRNMTCPAAGEVAAPSGKGFQWYKIGTVQNLRETFAFLDASWRTQLHFYRDELFGKPFELWVSIKADGPKFFKDSKEKENYIWIERVVLVENPASS